MGVGLLRVERNVRVSDLDSTAHRMKREIPLYFPKWANNAPELRFTEVFWAVSSKGDLKTSLQEILQSPMHDLSFDHSVRPFDAPSANTWCIEKHFRFGVTDNSGAVLAEAIKLVSEESVDAQARSGQKLWLRFGKAVEREEVEEYARTVFYNDLIETCRVWNASETSLFDSLFEYEEVSSHFRTPPAISEAKIESIDVGSMSVVEFADLARKRLWAFSDEECQTLIRYYKSLGRPATDVEIEVFAQTWSEHCKHKIFAAYIDVESQRPELDLPNAVDGIFRTYIRGSTEKIKKEYLRSVFHDNAGVISIADSEESVDVAIKVETHNSPSALDPYGGALTGIVGVNRDILGVGLGAEPIANLDVFCVGPLDYADPLPERLHHPRRILEGVRSGVQDGGNKSGIPTVTGAVVHHPSYLGKPLVYCGTVGLIPNGSRDLLTKKIKTGDAIVMAGGRIGKDGIHGATFSSLELNEESPASAVQLGDPLTQRRVWDFLLEARDAGLYRAVTDNGAGGLSSSVGELARLCGERGGAKLDLSSAKTKYPGLLPYELLVSESQERMTFAVPQSDLQSFLELADRRGVECSVLGAFEDSGVFETVFNGRRVSYIDLEFLHEGVPRMKLKATVPALRKVEQVSRIGAWNDVLRKKELSLAEALPAVLASPNVRTRRWLTEQYDHEVGARSVRAPYKSPNRGSPNDGGTLRVSRKTGLGVAIGVGLAPALAAIDPARAAALSVDEAFRNALAAGMDPDHSALVDNFCWPDPLPGPGNPDAEEKLGALVSTSKVLHDAAIALGAPFVSGKDSMKNDYRMGGLKISVLPTILVTAMGKVCDARAVPASYCQAYDQAVYWISAQDPSPDEFGLPKIDFNRLRRFSLRFHEAHRKGLMKSVHDVSDGGWLVTTAEMFFGTGFGARLLVSDDELPWLRRLSEKEQAWTGWFTESASSFVALVDFNDTKPFETLFEGFFVKNVGTTTSEAVLEAASIRWSIQDLERAYHGS